MLTTPRLAPSYTRILVSSSWVRFGSGATDVLDTNFGSGRTPLRLVLIGREANTGASRCITERFLSVCRGRTWHDAGMLGDEPSCHRSSRQSTYQTANE